MYFSLWSAPSYALFSPANCCYGNQVNMVTMSTVARGIFIYSLRHTTSHMTCMVKILGDLNNTIFNFAKKTKT